MPNSLDILNSIRSVAGADYQERIPEATRENIATVGNTILQKSASLNTFFNELHNRIGRVIVSRMSEMEDIYSVFGNEELPYGDTIQEIFVDIPKAKPFEGAETETPESMLRVEKGVLHVEYTSIDRKLFYKQTISKAELKEAFLTPEKLDDLIRGLVDAMNTALSYDKYIMFTETLLTHANYILSADDDEGEDVIKVLRVPESVAKYNNATKEIEWSATGAKDFLKKLRIVSHGLRFPHTLYYCPYSQVTGLVSTGDAKTIEAQRTEMADLVAGLEVSTLAEIDVNALAVIFHLEPANIQTKVIELEDGALGHAKINGTTLSDTVYIGGFICNKSGGHRVTSLEDNESFMNPEHLYVNYWKHFWGAMAISKFKDFVPIVFTAYTPAGETVAEESDGE